MKRRHFLGNSGLALASQLVASNDADAQKTGRELIPRPGRVVNNDPASLPVVLQDIVFDGENTITLFRRTSTGVFSIAATSVEGTNLWTWELPTKGNYLALGVDDVTGEVIVHALYYFRQAERATPDSLLLLDPQSGKLSYLDSLPASMSSVPMHFLGSSRYMRADAGKAEVWNISSRARTMAHAPSIQTFSMPPHIDLIFPGTASLFSPDGAVRVTVDLSGGTTARQLISDPQLEQSKSMYREYFSAHGIDQTRSHATVITASGSLVAQPSGVVYALAAPYIENNARLVTLDESGLVSTRAALKLPRRDAGRFGVAMKLLCRSQEIGVCFFDGSVAWYSLL